MHLQASKTVVDNQAPMVAMMTLTTQNRTVGDDDDADNDDDEQKRTTNITAMVGDNTAKHDSDNGMNIETVHNSVDVIAMKSRLMLVRIATVITIMA